MDKVILYDVSFQGSHVVKIAYYMSTQATYREVTSYVHL